jgi:hypothetical protein
LELSCIMTNVMQMFLIYLSIYFWLNLFRAFFSPSSEAGVQLRQWFKTPGYGKKNEILQIFQKTETAGGFQYSKINVMHFLFSLLRITGLYMVRALLVQLQEALHKRHLVYCVRVMSVGCPRIGVPHQFWCNQLT